MDPLCYLCFVFVCHTVLSVPCSLVVICCKRADLLAFFFFLCFCSFTIRSPMSDVVFDCINAWSLPSSSLLLYISEDNRL